MKKILLCFLAAASASCGFAQTSNPQKCGTFDKIQQLQATDPGYNKRRAKIEQHTQKWIAANQNSKMPVFVTVPVVVHVIWRTSAENISLSRVQEQIDVLNQDYRRLNSDTGNTPTVWKSIAADTEIEFCLATKDPSGNTTTGIDYKQTSTQNIGSTNNYYSSSAGLASWDHNNYMNIWVCEIGGGTLGFAYLPGAPAAYDGIVIDVTVFGKTGTSAPYNLGRTTSHEVGHWFNLEHIWGDDGGACSGTDGVSDTPNEADATYGCPGFPHTDNCSPNSPGIMFMNYMDYSDDNCMNMFTNGQKSRMQAVFATGGPRETIKNSTGCAGTTATTDAGMLNIIQPVGTLCTTTFTPVVTLKNFGSQALTSCAINYKIDANPATTYSWTGPSLAAGATASVTLPSMTTTSGSHTFTVFTSNPNGTTDGNTTNDQTTGSFTVSGGQTLPFTEGFEGTVFLPAGWTLNNPDGATTWVQATTGQASAKSAYMTNFSYNANKQIDEMVSPVIDLSSLSTPTLTFYVAYELYTDPAASTNYSDTLEVLISSDCGATYTSIYKKFSTALTTTTPPFDTIEFVPNANQWRMETISLANYSSATTAVLKFRNITDYENDLFLDNINISGGGSSCSSLNVTTASTNPGCGQTNGSATATASGGTTPYTYLWSNGQTTATATSLAAGSYTVTVSDSNNCSKPATVSLSSSGAPAVTTSAVAVNCNGGNNGSATVSATGGNSPYSYSWSNGSTSSTASNLSAGIYTVTVTDTGGCSATSSVTVSQPASSVGGTTTTTAANCGSNNGSATVAGSGGTGPYTYLWSGGQTNPTINGLAAGNYSVTITDNNGCTGNATASVSNTNGPSVSINQINASAFGVCDGAANSTVSGGTSPYTYQWSNSATTSSLTGLCAGTYNLTVTDANNCISTSSVTITQPTGISPAQENFYVNLFPNPTTGKLTVNISLNKAENIQITVYNVIGEKIIVLKRDNFTGGRIEIDLVNQSKGIYFVEVNTSDNSTVKKISLVK